MVYRKAGQSHRSRIKRTVQKDDRTKSFRTGGNSSTQREPFKQLDWSVRYSSTWRSTILPLAHKATRGYCCYCLKAKSETVHHTRYKFPNGLPIAMNEKAAIGVYLFPVCDWCHDKILHRPGNWLKDKVDPLWGNHNIKAVEKRLQLGFMLLNSGKKRLD